MAGVVSLPLRVLIVDAQRMFREGIRSRLEQEPDIQVVGEAASAEEAVEQLPQTSPTIVLLDLRLPHMSGIELVRLLRKRWPDLKILVLTEYDTGQYVRAAARAGTDGYVLKYASQEELVVALRDITAAEATLLRHIAPRLMRNYSSGLRDRRVGRSAELTLKEIEVLELLSQGLQNREIASQLSISHRTVEAHVGTLMAKLGAQSRTEAIIMALRSGMLEGGTPKT